MLLKDHLIEVNAKGLIACCECHAIADISMNASHLDLLCPSCYRKFGRWKSKSEALVELTLFIANGKRSD